MELACEPSQQRTQLAGEQAVGLGSMVTGEGGLATTPVPLPLARFREYKNADCMEKLLIVEDDPEMAGLLETALQEEGYLCSKAANGSIGLTMAPNHDLLIVDAMMPVMNGFTMIQRLREQGHLMPAIFLTARDTTKDIVLGLECGADDYLVKPFKLEELMARIKAALRRSKFESPTLTWQSLRVDCKKRTAYVGTREIFLSPTEFLLLELFVRRPGVVLSKSMILDEVWHASDSRDENIVELYVNYLRRKTELAGEPRILQTVRRRGYVLATSYLES